MGHDKARDSWLSGFRHGLRSGVMLMVLSALVPAWANTAPAASPAQAASAQGYVATATCLGCHAEQAKQWQDSDHGWAMRDATAANVLGNFKNAQFDEAGVKARFFPRASAFSSTPRVKRARRRISRSSIPSGTTRCSSTWWLCPVAGCRR